MTEADPSTSPMCEPGEPKTSGSPLLRVLALALSLGITAAIIAFREPLARFAANGYAGYGYLGVFIVSVVGNATVLLPVPSILGVFAGGSILNPVITGLVAGVAEPLGELTGYLAGYGGRGVVENRARYEMLQRWMQRHGFVTLFVLAAIPNPLFDVAGVVAGALHVPVWKFLLSCWLGKTLKALAIAWLGSLSVQWLAPLLQTLRGG